MQRGEKTCINLAVVQIFLATILHANMLPRQFGLPFGFLFTSRQTGMALEKGVYLPAPWDDLDLLPFSHGPDPSCGCLAVHPALGLIIAPLQQSCGTANTRDCAVAVAASSSSSSALLSAPAAAPCPPMPILLSAWPSIFK